FFRASNKHRRRFGPSTRLTSKSGGRSSGQPRPGAMRPSHRGKSPSLMRIAKAPDPEAAAEQEKTETRERVRARRETERTVRSKPEPIVEIIPPELDDGTGPDYGPQTTGINPPAARRRGLLYRATEALRLAKFDDLAGLTVDDTEIIAVVRETAMAWS